MSTATIMQHELRRTSEIARALPRLSWETVLRLQKAGVRTLAELRAVSDQTLRQQRLTDNDIERARHWLAQHDGGR